MKYLFCCFSLLLSLSSFAALTVQTFRGQSPDGPQACELTLKTDGKNIKAYYLFGPGTIQTNFGACEKICRYPDMKNDMLDEKVFERYKFRQLNAETYPQVTLSSRFAKEEYIFISRTLEIDFTGDQPDEYRYVEGTEVSTFPTVLSQSRCLHLKPVKTGSK